MDLIPINIKVVVCLDNTHVRNRLLMRRIYSVVYNDYDGPSRRGN